MRLRQSGLAWRELDGEMVVLDLVSSTYLTTNRSGAVLLELLAEERSTRELVEGLVDRYGVDHGTAAADVDAFVRVLTDKGLLEPSRAAVEDSGGEAQGAGPSS